jgi:hypothetical protein
MRFCLSVTFLLTLSIFVFSHPGGHGKVSKGELRQWYDVNSNLLAEGSFLLAKGDRVILEDSESKNIELKLESLCCKDIYYVVSYAKEIDRINTLPQFTHVVVPRQEFHWVRLILISICVITWAAVIYLLCQTRYSLTRRYSFSLIAFLLISGAACIVACSKSSSVVLKSGANDPTVVNATFTPYQNLISTHWDDIYFYVENSTGIPAHQMMVGITKWIDQVPIPQSYTGQNAWAIPLKTKYSGSPIDVTTELRKGAVAVAANGIGIFNMYNASGLISEDIGELDQFGGHSGRGDDYHYHIAPLHLESAAGNNPIGYALDGYALYGSKEPDGTAMKSLDEYSGHEWSDGVFHYHGTKTDPYLMPKLRGTVTVDGTIPENMIIPQPAEGNSLRGDNLHVISGKAMQIKIIDFQPRSSGTGYILSYVADGKPGSVEYYWDSTNLYTFIFNDADGTTTTQTFQR